IPCSPDGYLDTGKLEHTIKSNTVLIILNHASNVTGTTLPIVEVGRIARKHNILFLLDAAQTAGCFPIDIKRDNIDFLAFTGHKALFGPTGTGGLVIGERVNIDNLSPLKSGGTGSQSESEDQPVFLPDKYESGTLNIAGLAGLKEGVRFILKRGIHNIHQYELAITQKLISGLRGIPKVTVHGVANNTDRVAVVSFNIKDKSPSEVGLIL
ncbi:aminotransferase class V-fold PLP-dependent enzyme, partial [bacterium]|nr:aminotransferase class V-fold PLP-dependent enzyme [bacterium]